MFSLTLITYDASLVQRTLLQLDYNRNHIWPMTPFEDIQPAIDATNEPISDDRSTYIGHQWHWFRQGIAKGIVSPHTVKPSTALSKR